jgi:hypothetical protein
MEGLDQVLLELIMLHGQAKPSEERVCALMRCINLARASAETEAEQGVYESLYILVCQQLTFGK